MYLLKRKSETIPILQNFYKMVQIQLGVQVQVIRSDNGIEFQICSPVKMALYINLHVWISLNKMGSLNKRIDISSK